MITLQRFNDLGRFIAIVICLDYLIVMLFNEGPAMLWESNCLEHLMVMLSSWGLEFPASRPLVQRNLPRTARLASLSLSASRDVCLNLLVDVF